MPVRWLRPFLPPGTIPPCRTVNELKEVVQRYAPRHRENKYFAQISAE